MSKWRDFPCDFNDIDIARQALTKRYVFTVLNLPHAAFLASSRRARRKILPTLVFGNSVRNSTNFGTL